MSKIIKKSFSFFRIIPIFFLLIGLFLFYYFGLFQYLNFTSLEQYYQTLIVWKNAHQLMSIIFFMLFYTVCIACFIPANAILTITAGFLFGIWMGMCLAIISATFGAILVFLATRTSFGTWLATKAAPKIKKFKAGFQASAFNYLLTLRLIPIFPFWLINIIAGLLTVRLSTFFMATLVGIIPSTLIYSFIGNRLENILAQGELPSWEIIFTPAIYFCLFGLAILSALPIILRSLNKGVNIQGVE